MYRMFTHMHIMHALWKCGYVSVSMKWKYKICIYCNPPPATDSCRCRCRLCCCWWCCLDKYAIGNVLGVGELCGVSCAPRIQMPSPVPAPALPPALAGRKLYNLNLPVRHQPVSGRTGGGGRHGRWHCGSVAAKRPSIVRQQRHSIINVTSTLQTLMYGKFKVPARESGCHYAIL